MGYTKVVQYGDTTEIYQYEKNYINNKKGRYLSTIQKKRAKERRQSNKHRSKYSIRRAKQKFYRLCHANNTAEKTDSIVFCTLTFNITLTIQECYKKIAQFFRRLKTKLNESKGYKEISYIGVPERTKKGRWHFHLLIYNLPSEIVKKERYTRNLQRLYRAGYLHLDIAYDRSPKIASYMAKYMGKFLSSPDNERTKSYTCSRNIVKITDVGSNSLSEYLDMIVDNDSLFSNNEYKVPYLGNCIKKIYKK